MLLLGDQNGMETDGNVAELIGAPFTVTMIVSSNRTTVTLVVYLEKIFEGYFLALIVAPVIGMRHW